jgi:hypothetical protein
MQQLKNDIFPTGDHYVDSVMNKYYLTKLWYYPQNLPGIDLLLLNTASNLNLLALSNVWTIIPGVDHAGPDLLIGDGNDITDSIFDDHVELTYDHSWNCEYGGGCSFHHFWKFNIYFDCTVEFVSSYGDPISGLGISNLKMGPIELYPNPFNDKLRLEGIDSPSTYEIYNLQGQKLITGTSYNGEIKNLNMLENGIYVLSISSNNKNYRIKIIK